MKLIALISFLLSGCAIAQIDLPAQAPASAASAPRRIGYYEKQGYPKEQSAAMLDPEVRSLLDGVLRLYREPGLFTNRRKSLEVLHVQETNRRWSLAEPVVAGHRAYVDRFGKDGLFSRPAWVGEYVYTGRRQDRQDQWHAAIRISVDPKLQCHDSRAVEGYLDLVLDPGIRGIDHPVEGRLRRHEVPYAEPYGLPMAFSTPMLILQFSEGCLAKLDLVRMFALKEVSDDKAHD